MQNGTERAGHWHRTVNECYQEGEPSVLLCFCGFFGWVCLFAKLFGAIGRFFCICKLSQVSGVALALLKDHLCPTLVQQHVGLTGGVDRGG